jgi:hypothetical protein
MGGERRACRGCGKRTDGEDMSETHVFFGANLIREDSESLSLT